MFVTVIDAHQHFWDPGRVDYPWLAPAFPALNRSIGADELLPLLRAAGVDATVLVQSADSAEDTDFMFEVAGPHPEIAGVVAWVPLDQPATTERMLAELAGRDRFVGIRNLVHTRDDPDWVVSADVASSLRMLEAAHVPFDLVAVLPRHLEHVPVLCERHPGLRIVIDHLAKPPIGADEREPWASLMAVASRSPNVFAKVSGLYPGDDPRRWTVQHLKPIVHQALELFGADRLMFGSDWPICEVAGGYEAVTGALFSVFEDFDPDQRRALLGGTAISFYGLEVKPQ
jgi:L-fuconolactonase